MNFIQRTNETNIHDMNGKFLFDEPSTTQIEISINDFGDATTNISNAFLLLYPDYSNIIFNPLPIQSDFDATASLITQTSRCQLGSHYNSCAILPKNENTNANGVLITDTITLSSSSDTFLVYWKTANIDYSVEQSVNENIPSSITYSIQSSSDIDVYLSNDDGLTYTQADFLSPVSFSSGSTTMRIAFVNNSLNKIHLLGYAILY